MTDFPGKTEWVWMNGELVRWEDAKIHIASHVVHYGSAVFEGIRAYKTPRGTAVFRLDAHLERMYYSCKIYRMDVPYPMETLRQAILDLIRKNQVEECYIRPIVYRGYGALGVDPAGCPVDVAILMWRWGKYLGDEALQRGVDVVVSSWFRNAPNTTPPLAKAAANYMNAQLIKLEAKSRNRVEGIALDVHGFVSEGSGENLFLVYKGTLYTPALASSILFGITRDSVITLARDLNIPVVETWIPREMLYIADEVFLTGTAAEITPVRSIDDIVVGRGEPGAVTRRIQDAFFGLIQGRWPDRYQWLTYV